MRKKFKCLFEINGIYLILINKILSTKLSIWNKKWLRKKFSYIIKKFVINIKEL